MKLATIRTPEGTRAVRVEEDGYVDLGFRDVGELLAQDDWRTTAAAAGGTTYQGDIDFAPVVPRPGKVICVGLNYRNHILEMGRDLPEHPTLFAKFAEALIGANDDIDLAPESDAVDWEAELTVVIGRTVRRATEAEAIDAIAGFTTRTGSPCTVCGRRTSAGFTSRSIPTTTSPTGPTTGSGTRWRPASVTARTAGS